jgi:hypothetical protein
VNTHVDALVNLAAFHYGEAERLGGQDGEWSRSQVRCVPWVLARAQVHRVGRCVAMTAVNDMGVVLAVLAVAEDPGYALVDQDVYLRESKKSNRDLASLVAADEAQVVRQLVESGHLRLGDGRHLYRFDRRLIEGCHVLTTPFGRSCRRRWSALKPLQQNQQEGQGR